jgi:uncharacterized secreted protein with C-terminal beta-propeller domain
MADLRITINLNNDAFHVDEFNEVSRILDNLSRKVARGDMRDQRIMDSNGNTVGSFTVIDEDA